MNPIQPPKGAVKVDLTGAQLPHGVGVSRCLLAGVPSYYGAKHIECCCVFVLGEMVW